MLWRFPVTRGSWALNSTKPRFSAAAKARWRKKTSSLKREFPRIASSNRLDNHKGCLRQFSLLCIENSRFKGAAQFWPGGFGCTVREKSRAILCGLPDFLSTLCAKTVSPKPMFSCVNAPLAGRFFIVSYRFTASPFPQRYCLRSRRAALFSPARLRLSSPFAANRSSPA